MGVPEIVQLIGSLSHDICRKSLSERPKWCWISALRAMFKGCSWKDMIAIPDFAAGAMENWGLVTYREVALLCEEATVSATQKQRICGVIAHELAHQWFGNLVTMEWWDDLWLNEGFANWMQTFSSDRLFPEWHFWETYVGMEQQRALQLDALRSSHPIQVPIAKAEQVEEVFDAISYCKGGTWVLIATSFLRFHSFTACWVGLFN